MTMFLTHAELVELTERKTKGAQIAWLKANRFQFATGANGHPKVLRSHVQVKLCGGAVAPAGYSSAEPNWGAL